jgi:hypothetical protein
MDANWCWLWFCTEERPKMITTDASISDIKLSPFPEGKGIG